jgi:hypothetical protein
MDKVFAVGAMKTATSSLAAALYTLGYNVTGYFGAGDEHIAENALTTAFSLADRFDAAQDTPWFVLYRELDERYPGSKFILTTRPSDEWYDSVVRHFKGNRIQSHEWIFGVRSARFHRRQYVERYEQHNRDVRQYFADRPGDLLEIDIHSELSWEVLCPFLGKPTPRCPFPRQNLAAQRDGPRLRRASQYAVRKIGLSLGRGGRDRMPTGVTAAALRDVLHYHTSMGERVERAVEGLDDDLLHKQLGDHPSVAAQLAASIDVDGRWLARLRGDPDPARLEPADPGLLDAAAVARVNLREHLANLDDTACNAPLPGRREVVWEALVDLAIDGAERRTLIESSLAGHGVPLQLDSFRGVLGFDDSR